MVLKNFFARVGSAAEKETDSPLAQLPVLKRMMDPTPEFCGALLSGVFWEPALGFTAEEIESLLAKLPRALRERAKLWTAVYLAYILFLLIEETYGPEFASNALSFVRQYNQRAENKIDDIEQIAALFDYWFPYLKAAISVPAHAPEPIKAAPPQLLAAYAFIDRGPDGPIIVPGADGDIQAALADVLIEAQARRIERYRLGVRIGAPLEDIDDKPAE